MAHGPEEPTGAAVKQKQWYVMLYCLDTGSAPTFLVPGCFDDRRTAVEATLERMGEIGAVTTPDLECNCGGCFDIEREGARGTCTIMTVEEFAERQMRTLAYHDAWERRN